MRVIRVVVREDWGKLVDHRAELRVTSDVANESEKGCVYMQRVLRGEEETMTTRVEMRMKKSGK